MGLRKIVDNMKPTFSEGGKLSFLASTFDAFETFLFVPNTTTSKGAHIRDCNDMKRTMIVVVLALLPAFLSDASTRVCKWDSQGSRRSRTVWCVSCLWCAYRTSWVWA